MKISKAFSLPLLLSLALSGTAFSANGTWTSTSNGTWATTSNWLNNTAPGTTNQNGSGDIATFNTSTGVIVTMATRSLNSLNFDTEAGSFTFSFGNGFYFASGGGINLLASMTSTDKTMTINSAVNAIGSFGINNNATTSNILIINGSLTNTKTTAGNAIVSLGGSNSGNNTIAGIISDGGTRATQINKSGSGTWQLTGTNTYTGGTLVSAGRLVIGVNGSGSVSGPVNVSAGTLAGSGSAVGNVTVGDGSIGGHDSFITPDGTFTTNGTLSLLSDAAFSFDLNSTIGTANKLIANGVNIDSAALFSFTDLGLGTGVTDGQVFSLIDNTSGTAILGQFSNLLDGSSFVSNGITYTASYSGGTGNDLILTAAIPEPGTWIMVLGGAIFVLFRLRSRRQISL